MEELPSSRVFPYVSKICFCFFKKDRKKDKVMKNLDIISESLMNRISIKGVSTESGLLNQQSLLQKLQQENYNRTVRKHPYLILGRGLHGWLQLIEVFIIVFALMSIIAFSQMYMFKLQSPDYLSENTFNLPRAISSVSLGSQQFSYPACAIVPIELNNMHITCSGSLTVQKIIDYGVTKLNSNACYKEQTDDDDKNHPCAKDLNLANILIKLIR